MNSETKGTVENKHRNKERQRGRCEGSEARLMRVEEGWRGEERTAEEEGKATREVTSAVNNLSFKIQSEALIGAVA